MSNKKYLKFTNYKYELKAPYVIYADFECFINSNNKHIPSRFAYVVVSWKSEIIYQTCYSEENIMDEFFKQILADNTQLSGFRRMNGNEYLPENYVFKDGTYVISSNGDRYIIYYKKDGGKFKSRDEFRIE